MASKQVYLFLTITFLFVSNLISQNSKLDSLLNSFAQEKTDTLKAKTAYRLASFYISKGQIDSAYTYAAKSKTLSKQSDFLYGLAVSSNFIGQVYSYKGLSDSAIHYFKTAMNYYEQMKDVGRVAGMLNNLGIAYKNKGNLEMALEHYFRSLKVKEQLQDSFGMANAYHNIAELYGEINDTANSIRYFKQALDIRRKIKDESGVGASLVTMGIYFKNNRQPEKAKEFFNEALKIAESLQEEESIAIASYNLGRLNYNEGKIKESEKLFNTSLALSRKNNDPKGVILCLEALGAIRMKENNSLPAIALFEEAYSICKEFDAYDLLGDVTNSLSEAYEKKGDYKKALSYSKISKIISDSIFNENNVRKFTSEALKYEHEKEKLLVQKELEKKEALTKAESFKKNLIISVSILFLLVVSYFSYSLFKKLEENKRQKLIIEEQQKEMIASINYAKRIQYALLANKDLLEQNLPEHFILFKPKDIVSGDFYWGALKNNYFYLAVCDCTGHGVPGAFMSLLNINFLNEAVNEKGIEAPGEILNHVREQLVKKLDGGRDGMDAILLRIPVHRKNSTTIAYAAANNSALLIRENQLTELHKDSMPVGLGEKAESFKTHTLAIQPGDCVYLYTDGFADQFGGPKGKKFKYKQLDDILLKNSLNSMNSQNTLLVDAFEQWRGKLEQVDDVCVLGIQF